MAISNLLSAKELAERGFGSRTTIWRNVRDGKFPQPIKIGDSTRWIESEVDAWLDHQSEMRDSDSPPPEDG
jgi:predicted DNA-binding transcriptional regulator AlpA